MTTSIEKGSLYGLPLFSSSLFHAGPDSQVKPALSVAGKGYAALVTASGHRLALTSSVE